MDENDRPTTNPDLETCTPQRCLGGRFVLLDRLGAGGGAVVVRARDRQFSKDVAIKLLCSRDADLQRRFTQESEVLREMDHPAIVRVLAHDRDGDDLYTALELIEGPDLGQHLARTGPLPWRHVIEIGSQLASALEAVHRKGLVHRDVKPTNIMLADGEQMRVKLIDFGIVRVTENYRLGARSTPWRPTDVGRALGTPGYLPLEAGLVPADARFDVFSLGVTLYELLTGTMPTVPLQPLREACARYDGPEDLALVLTTALALEPEDRTQSAAELGRALAAVRASHPVHGTPWMRIDGRYELIGLAGTGAKGDAHVAVHRGTGHDVILKFLRSKDPDDALRFAREAKILRTFDHPALPRFFDYAPEASPPYIAMAHAPGRPAVRLCSPPQLKPVEVAAVGLKLARVVAMIHAHGVLHRDINANNVLIDANGGVTLLDFGCAELSTKFYDVPAGERRYLTPPEARVTIPDGGIGRLSWSAPEVHGGQGWSDRSDVYSLAHLLFRLLTGKVPDKGADPPTSPLDHVRTCPADLAYAIVTALCPNPRDRPSAAQFAATLEDVLETEEEAVARVLAVIQPADRPPLRLVTTGPDKVDWTPHPIPQASSEPSEPPVSALPSPVTVAHASVKPPARSRLAATALGSGLLGAAAMWGLMVEPEALQSLAAMESPTFLAPVPTSPTSSPVSSLTSSISSPTPSTPSPPSTSQTPPQTSPTAASTPPRQSPASRPAGTKAPVVASIRPPQEPRAIDAPRRARTFAEIMTRLEPKIRECARKTGLADGPATVRVRSDPKSRVIDSVRVLNLSNEHPFTACAEALVRQAALPATISPIEDFTFLKARGPAAK